MAMTLSPAEYAFLGSVPEPDGWPLEMLAHGLEERAAASIRATALSLLKRDLIGLHGGPENVMDVPRGEAEAILTNLDAWSGKTREGWMVAATPAGAVAWRDAAQGDSDR